jgi:hypothetical protein
MAELKNWVVEITGEVVKQYSTVARSLEEAEENATQDFIEEFGDDADVDVVGAIGVEDGDSLEFEEEEIGS